MIFNVPFAVEGVNAAQLPEWPGKLAVSTDFPVPVGASALWDSRYGITLGAPGRVSQWVDRIDARVIAQATASQRPVYGVDAGGSASRSVVQAAVSGSKFLTAMGLVSLALAGSRPYVALVARQRVLCTNGLQIHFNVDGDSTFALRSGYQHSARGDGAGTEYWLCHRNSAGAALNITTGDTQNTQVHLWEYIVDASSGYSTYIDGVLVGNVNSTDGRAALASAHKNLSLGGVDSYPADVSIDIFLEVASTPTAAERAAMLAWARKYAGVP